MKKIILLLLIPLLLCGCKKRVDDFAFKGKVVGYVQCSGMVSSISEFDMGYVIALDTPESIGGDYTFTEKKVYHNCVILYHTRSRLQNDETISGRMYLDDQYSAAYCNFHFETGLPEGVCLSLD